MSDTRGGKNSHLLTSILSNKIIVPFHVKIFHCCFLELFIFGLKIIQALSRLLKLPFWISILCCHFGTLIPFHCTHEDTHQMCVFREVLFFFPPNFSLTTYEVPFSFELYNPYYLCTPLLDPILLGSIRFGAFGERFAWYNFKFNLQLKNN